jgi:hypothetical protein
MYEITVFAATGANAFEPVDMTPVLGGLAVQDSLITHLKRTTCPAPVLGPVFDYDFGDTLA